jgi:hypothetical protein
MKKILTLAIAVVLVGSTLTLPAFAAVKAGATCSKVGSVNTSGGKKFTCVKSGKKLVWYSGPDEAKSAATPKSPTSFANLYQNRNGIAYAAWKSTAESIAAGKSNIVNLNIYLGPTTVAPKYKTPEVALALVSQAFYKYKTPENVHVIQYSIEDVKWAEDKVKSIVDINDYNQLNGQEQGRLVSSNCGATECFGSKQVSTNSGIAFILQGVPKGNNNDPMVEARFVLGQLEAHEFTHAMQRATVSGQPTKEWPRVWIVEGSAELAQNLVMSYKSYAEYMKWRKFDSSRLYGKNSKITTALMTSYLDAKYNSDYWGSVDSYYAYNLGSRIIEIFVALKGSDIMLDLFRESALQGFEPAFQSLFGTTWAEASPIISKTVVELFQNGE